MARRTGAARKTGRQGRLGPKTRKITHGARRGLGARVRRRHRSIVLVAFGTAVFLWLATGRAQAACGTKYVDAAIGSNSTDCTSSTSPCLTIQYAIDQACANDTINVRPGIYNETAPMPSPPGCTGDTVGLYIGTGGLTIQGVTSSDVAITNSASVLATVNTISNLCFGPDGIFVQGDNVTIAGIRVGPNTGGQNKTIEVAGDNFTLSNCDIADVQGSVYFNDFDFDTVSNTSHLQSYHIVGNNFQDGVSLDLTNGAGFSGLVSGRTVTGNTFNNSQSWPSVSFNGSGTGVPWFVYSVGGAVITGNTFQNTAGDGQMIRARGTYDNTQFDWTSYWNQNVYNKAAVVGLTPPADVRTFSYSSGSYTFANVRRIGAVIQGEVDHAQAGDTVLVMAGTYAENLVVSTPLTLAGAGQGASIVHPAVSNPNPCTGSSLCGGAASNIILVQADDVTIHDLTLDGDNPNLSSGITRGGADLDARNGIITNYSIGNFHNTAVYNTTVQNVYLRGIYAASASYGNTFNFHDNTISNVQGDYYSIGMFNFGGSGVMQNNTVSGANDGISANWSQGTQFLNNTITGSGSGVHTDNSGGGGSISADVIAGNHVSNCMAGGYGIFTFVPYVAPAVRGNTVSGCDVGMAAAGQGPAADFSDNVVDGMNRANSVGVYVTTSEFGWGSGNVSATFTRNLIENNTDGFQLQDKTCSATTTQGCRTNGDCPSGETCTLGYTLTVNAGCNRISDNGTGVLAEALSSPASAVLSDNVLEGNTLGIDGSEIPAGPAMDAQNNFWGCPAGPGGAGCDTLVGNVQYLPVSVSAPACAYCSVNSECDDGLACNGVETCDTTNAVCQVTTSPPSCSLPSGTDARCNNAVCVDPSGTCSVAAKPDGSPCNNGDNCEAGVCVGPNSLTLSTLRLKRDTGGKHPNGSALVWAQVNDNSTGGNLVDNLKAGSVTVEVSNLPSGSFHAIVPLQNCKQSRSGAVTCQTKTLSARFGRVPGPRPLPLVYLMRVTQSRLGATQTGTVLPSGPVTVVLHQNLVTRSLTNNNCKAQGKYAVVCHGS